MISRSKYLSIIVFLIIASCQFTFSQCEWDYKTVRLYSQSEVDSFLIKYPDCTELWELIISEQNPESDPITNLRGLDSLKSIGNLAIGGCDKLENLKGLENVTSIHTLAILDNVKINSLDELKGIDHVNELTVWFDELVPDLRILGSKRVLDYLSLEGNSTMEGYEIVEDDFTLRIQENSFQNDIGTLLGSNIKDFKLYLHRVDNFSFNGLSDYDHMEALTIESSDSLDLSGLSSIRELDNLFLTSCSLVQPKNLNCFRNLETVNSHLIIAGIDDMLSLNELVPELKFIGHGLSLAFNSSLNDVTVLDQLDIPEEDFIYNSGIWSGGLIGNNRLVVFQNSSLSDCNLGFFCRMIESYPDNVAIYDNGSEACSKDHLTVECNSTFTGEVIYIHEGVVYPNPTTGILHIDIPSSRIDGIKLFSQNGEEKKIHYEGEEMDMSHLVSGVYILQLETHEGIVYERIVKL